MTVPQIKVRVVRRPQVKLKVLPRFPSDVTVISPILLSRVGGNFAFSFDQTASNSSITIDAGQVISGMFATARLPAITTTGATSALRLEALLADALWPEKFGAADTFSASVDDTAFVQAAINAAQTTGKVLLLRRKYRLLQNGANLYCLIITATLKMFGKGQGNLDTEQAFGSSEAWLFPDATVANTVDTILVFGSANQSLSGLHIENVRIGNNAANVGNRQIYIDTRGGAGHQFGGAVFRHNHLYNTNSGMSFYHQNDTNAASNGGMYFSKIEHNMIGGAIALELTGPSNSISYNYINGAFSGAALRYSDIAGSVGGWIEHNTFADTSGAVVIDSGDQVVIRGNRVELSGASTGSNHAVVDITGATRSVKGAILENNTLGFLGTDATMTTVVRVANATDTMIGQNNWYSSLAGFNAAGHWITITAAAVNTRIDSAQYFQPATVTTPNQVSDAGTGTVYSFFTAAKNSVANAQLAADVFSSAHTWTNTQQYVANAFALDGSSSGSTILNAAAVAGSTTATLPANTGTIAELNFAQQWTALQIFNPNDFALAGATSGTIKLNAADVAGSNSIKFPAGTTDFTATGPGAVQQASSGAPLTVGPLASSQIAGTGTNDSAASGNLGEFISSSVVIGSAVALTTNVPVNITSISLTAGDWEVQGDIYFTGAATTTVIYQASCVSQTTGTFDLTVGNFNIAPGYGSVPFGATTGNTSGIGILTPVIRKSLASTTTMFLVAQSGFGVSTQSAFGVIRARRAR